MKVIGKTRMPRTEEGKGGDQENDDDEDSEEEETDEEDGKLSNKEQQKDKETEDDNDEEEESDEQDDNDVDKGINTEIFVVQLLVLRSKMTKSLVCYENVDPEPSQV